MRELVISCIANIAAMYKEENILENYDTSIEGLSVLSDQELLDIYTDLVFGG